MTQPQDEDNAYTHLILGTSLTHCILSASLHQSSTGCKVLQVDSNDYYGGENASLTLSQLESYLGSLPSTSKARVGFPAFEATGGKGGLPTQLKSLDRHYSLSLTPALLAAHGPALDALVRSKVAEYATFRLLQRTAVYSGEDKEEETGALAGSSSRLRPVPSSKEDVFKTPTSVLSLLDKRKLMKLLQWCATAPLDNTTSSGGDGGGDATLSSARSSPNLWAFLTSGNQRLSPSLASAIAYGLCLSPDAHTEPPIPALRRLQTHLRSTGKYGNAAYLVAQYGGAGELVQGYARAAAVRGATFVLGKGVERCERGDEEEEGGRRQYFDVRLKDVDETFRCEKVVGSRKELEKLGLVQPSDASAPSSKRGKAKLQGLLLLDRGIQMPSPTGAASSSSSTSDTPQEAPSPIETALIVFPPQSLSLASGKHNAVTVTALVLGEGTFCCPKGQYVVHLTAANLAGQDVEAAEELFEAAKRAVLGLARGSEVEWKPASANAQKGEGEDKVTAKDASDDVVPLMEALWLSTDGGEEAIEVVSAPASADSTLRPPSPISSDAATSASPSLLSTILDTSTQRAEALFYSLHGLTPEEAAAAAATRRSRRRRRRDAAEYRGRGGAGPEDEEENEDEGEEGQDREEEQEEVPLFFGGERRRGGDEDDDEDS